MGNRNKIDLHIKENLYLNKNYMQSDMEPAPKEE